MKLLLSAAVAAMALGGTANAATLLTVDIGTENRITITATEAVSPVSVRGEDITGFLLADFLEAGAPFVATFSASSDLTSAEDTSSDGAVLFNNGFSTGLNVEEYTLSLFSFFVAGNRAFSGSATWTVREDFYEAALAGPGSGNVYFPAESDDDIPNAALLGEWVKEGVPETPAVPLPAAGWLLACAMAGMGVAGARRRA